MLPKSPAAQAQWPPRSPREVLLSTPGGRARLRAIDSSRTSPAPLRTRHVAGRGLGAMGADGGTSRGEEDAEEDEEDEEDEETLRLQLQEIQAKLRLKKLQAAKAQKSAVAAGAPALSSARSTPGSARIGPGSSAATFHNPQSPPRSTVEVPASPVRREQPAAGAAVHKSPKRVLLGIDKGLRGQDVSLKRPPSSFRRGLTSSATSSSILDGRGASQNEPTPRPLSFNERLAAARSQEASRKDKSERIQQLRTSAFPVNKDEMDQYKSKAVDIPVVDDGPLQYSRDDIVAAATGRAAGGTLLRRSNTTPNIRSAYGDEENTAPKEGGGGDAASDAVSFEPYSGFHLTRRILPHSAVTRSVTGKTTYTIQDLLRQVKAPHFELPEVETDVVVLGIVAEKSDPRSHKPVAGKTGANQDRGKYMVMTLVDLTYQIEVFLFKSGFDRFWKISTGTVVAILNPGIMPPPPGRHDTGRWSLVINSDSDTILEVGIARDLGYCKSIKRDGHQCSAWVNAKRTEFCEFHVNEAAKKMRAARNELNGAAGFGSADDSRSGRGRGGRGGRGGGERGGYGGRRGGRDGPASSGYDSYAQSQWYVAGQGASASSLIDDEALNGGYADKVERQEGIKRRLAAKERETDIARKLGELGSGAGRDYMKLTAREQQQKKAAAAAAAAAAAESAAAASSSRTKTKGSGSTSESASASSIASSSAAARSSQSQLSAASSMTTTGTVAEQAAASRASLLASVAARRGGGAGGSATGGLNISNNTPDPDGGKSGGAGGSTPVIHLGPAKRKRPQSSLSSSVATSAGGSLSSRAATGASGGGPSHGFGWGSDLRAKLGRMKDGEKLANNHTIENSLKRAAETLASSASTPILPPPERSPVRKKTRFLLGGKGIREAGRESLGATDHGAGGDDDDDDELIII